MWPEQQQQHHCYWFCWCKTQCLQCCKTTPWHEWIGSRDRKAASSPRSQRCRSWKEICCPRCGSLWKAALWLDPRWLDAVIRSLIEQLLSAAVSDLAFFFSQFLLLWEDCWEVGFRFFPLRNRVPPQPKKTRCHRAPNIKLSEDRLVESYYARHPEAKIIPFEWGFNELLHLLHGIVLRSSLFLQRNFSPHPSAAAFFSSLGF